MSPQLEAPSWEMQLRQVFGCSDDPVLTAVEVAESLEITQQAAYSKLVKAHKHGIIERKKTGSRAVVWWLKN